MLLDIIEASALAKHEKKILSDPNLTLLLVHDVVLGKGIQAGDGPIKQAVLRHKTRMKAELTMTKVRRGVANVEELAQQDESTERIPRWARINVINVKPKDLMNELTANGFTRVPECEAINACVYIFLRLQLTERLFM